MPKPGSQARASCQFFGLAQTPNENNGWCVRYPPIVVYADRGVANPDDRLKTIWPVVYLDYWCGEWKQAGPVVEAQ